MKAVYFAWIRERVGKAEEQFAPPTEVSTVVGETCRIIRLAPPGA